MSADASAPRTTTRSEAVAATGPARRPEPDARGPRGPILIAGADRSGTTLLYALLASHPNVSMVRRTNMWRYFHRRYGDLGDAANLDRCLHDMLCYRRMQHLHPDPERIREEFLQGEPTYGRLFALFHQHHAESMGKTRWGDKSLHTERYADRVFAEYPDARIVHTIRDPRDRYASVRKRHGKDVPRVGAATGRWLASTRDARRNRRRYPDRYLIVRYEDLAMDPERMMRRICTFIGEGYTPEILSMEGARDHRDGGGNSSFGDVDTRTISTKAIGRYRTVLTPFELRYIELVAGGTMRRFGYRREGAPLSFAASLRFHLAFLPEQLARMASEAVWTRIRRWRGDRHPGFRFADRPITEADDET
jgi:hypothetical protein